jgi:hypothetical protein
MEPRIEEMMDFISEAIEGYFYDVISGYEVFFTKEKGWRLKKFKSDDQWLTFSSSDIIDVFNQKRIDLSSFQILLVHNIQTMGVYYNNQIKKIKKLLGPEVINDAHKAWNNFAQGLAKVIEKDLRLKNMRIVEDTDEYFQSPEKL